MNLRLLRPHHWSVECRTCHRSRMSEGFLLCILRRVWRAHSRTSRRSCWPTDCRSRISSSASFEALLPQSNRPSALISPAVCYRPAGYGTGHRKLPDCPCEASAGRGDWGRWNDTGRALLEAAADRGQKIDFAGFLDRIGQATDSHFAIDRNVDTRFQIAVLYQMGLDARELALEIFDHLAHGGAAYGDALLT